MSARLVALSARLEQRRGLLGLAKLANVGLAMLWGFVVTFVFVRLLPLGEFRAFLLLVAFANFTVSAELGFSMIVYSRLRQRVLNGAGGFRTEELGVLLAFMLGIIGTGAMLLILGLSAGLIVTHRPWLFLAFYGVASVNLIALLARRALAALDHNLWWELLDLVRRGSGVVLLLAALIGLPILDSVLIQLGTAMAIVIVGLVTVHRTLSMPVRHWWALRVGGGHIRAHYMADIGRTSALTVSDVLAYNAPYFTIAALCAEARPLLLFDFIFKMSRALSALFRALVETMLPDLTRVFSAGDREAFRDGLRRCVLFASGPVLALAILLLLAGGPLTSLMFDGKFSLQMVETIWIILLFVGLALICVSVYLNNGLGRFGALLRPSFAFLIGSLLSVPLAMALAKATGWSVSASFAACYATLHVGIGLVHGRLLMGLRP